MARSGWSSWRRWHCSWRQVWPPASAGPYSTRRHPLPTNLDPGGIDSLPIDWEQVIELIEELDLEWILDLFEPDTEDGSEPACTVALSNQPTPGAETTVYIRAHGGPVSDASVWFNGNYIGDTDARGTVTGTIPYERELVVEVATQDGTTCVGSDSIQGAQMGSLSTSPQVQQAENSSIQYEVRGGVNIAVSDQPYPGDVVDIRAAINGVPFAGATVALDGEERARTDDQGRATITLPDDGREAVRISASRGEFEGSVRVELLILDARIDPGGLAPLPGSDGAVVAEVGGAPVAGASVAIDGNPIGTTDASGRVPVVIPADPMTPVTVTTEHQSTTFTLLDQLLPMLGLAGIVLSVGGVVAHRWLGWRGPALLGVAVCSLLAVLAAEAYWGERGGMVAAGLVILPWVALAIQRGLRYGTVPTREGDWSILEWATNRIYDLVLWVVDGIDRFVDLLIGIAQLGVRGVRSLSLRSFLANPLGVVLSALGRTGKQLVAARRIILVGAGVLTLLVGGYALGDLVGLLVTAGVLTIGWIWYLQSAPESSHRDDSRSPRPEEAGRESTNTKRSRAVPRIVAFVCQGNPG
ncbi:MAG: hypothetical protein U5K37_13335 [Natrialbaceae archaeon]|nr:hypothetical protein [Natrialbaceae archaeon]